MTKHRRIVWTGVIVAALSAGASTAASAGSLLSGYGGPGQGSQAILGSTLVNGRSGGGGGSTSGGTGNSSGSFRYGEQSGETGSSAAGAAGAGVDAVRKSATRERRSRGQRAGGTSGSRKTGAGGASGGGASTYPTSSVERASGAGAEESETLGLPGSDWLYVLLGLVGLLTTGLLTWRLARTTTGARRRSLKVRPAGPE